MNQNSIPHLAPYTGSVQVQKNTPLHQDPTVSSEQWLDNKRSTRHPKTLWLGRSRAIHTFGKIECKSRSNIPYHNIQKQNHYTLMI